MHFRSHILTGLFLVGLLAGATGGARAVIPPDVSAPQVRHVITFPVNGFQYSPNDITILAGDEVEWSGPFAPHPLVSEDSLWPTVNSGDNFRFTFAQPGVYRYYCQIHGGPGGTGMSGVVRVAAPTRIYLPAILR